MLFSFSLYFWWVTSDEQKVKNENSFVFGGGDWFKA